MDFVQFLGAHDYFKPPGTRRLERDHGKDGECEWAGLSPIPHIDERVEALLTRDDEEDGAKEEQAAHESEPSGGKLPRGIRLSGQRWSFEKRCLQHVTQVGGSPKNGHLLAFLKGSRTVANVDFDRIETLAHQLTHDLEVEVEAITFKPDVVNTVTTKTLYIVNGSRRACRNVTLKSHVKTA